MLRYRPPDPTATAVAELHEHAGYLYLLTAEGWRAREGVAKLFRTQDGLAWAQVQEMAEPEGWALAVYQGDLYQGTHMEVGGGKVYRARWR